MILVLLACVLPTGDTGSAPTAGGWVEAECAHRTDPERWGIDLAEPGPVYMLVLRELDESDPQWLASGSQWWDEERQELYQTDPSGYIHDCRAWVAR